MVNAVNFFKKQLLEVASSRYNMQTEKSTCEIRYYITSLDPDPIKINKSIRAHWAIENNLHWSLDVIFNEDKSTKKKDNSPANFNIIRKVALS